MTIESFTPCHTCRVRFSLSNASSVPLCGECLTRLHHFQETLMKPAPTPTRLSLAKAALEAARAKVPLAITAYDIACENQRSALVSQQCAKDELASAEAEAAQVAAIPPKLLEVAREITDQDKIRDWVHGLLARSHGVSYDTLRRALEAK